MSVHNIFFTSWLPSHYAEALEGLLYFNGLQDRVCERIAFFVELRRPPRIVITDGILRIHVGSVPSVQSLFAVKREGATAELIGVIVYFRESINTMNVLHLAVREDYSSVGHHAEAMLSIRLIHMVREMASRIKGVSSVTLGYNKAKTRSIPVRNGGHNQRPVPQPMERSSWVGNHQAK